MPVFLMHVAVRRLLRVFGGGSSVAALEVENAVLRHLRDPLHCQQRVPDGPSLFAGAARIRPRTGSGTSRT
jgi:hypothetical protein